MFAVRPVKTADSDSALVPLPADWAVVVVPELKVELVPYKKLYVVALPSGLTVALSVAPVDVIEDAATVVAAGAGPAAADVVKCRIVPSVVPPVLVACTLK